MNHGIRQAVSAKKPVIASEAKQSSSAASVIDGVLDWRRRDWVASLRSQ